ncbi:MAG: hypothetical protein HUJ98_07345 [Bacteroidaceae bacterium]|nr:hypothetical protein [Bacteroidaceae bacterium]
MKQTADERYIADEEQIARILFAPSMILNGRVSPTAFNLDNLEHGPEKYVSVWRINLQVPTPGNVTFPPRKAGDCLIGYAELNTGACRQISFEDWAVEIHQRGKNLFHAGIEYSQGAKKIKGYCEHPSFIVVKKQLANISTFIEFVK